MEEISTINSSVHQSLLLSIVSVIHDKSDVSHKCKKSKIDLNMPINKIPIELLDEIEENHTLVKIMSCLPG